MDILKALLADGEVPKPVDFENEHTRLAQRLAFQAGYGYAVDDSRTDISWFQAYYEWTHQRDDLES